MFVNASNNEVAKISRYINSSQTSLTVDDASIFIVAPILVTVNNNRHNMEIMRVTNVGGNTLTVQRAQEGTTAQSHDAGSIVENNFTAGTYKALVDELKDIKEKIVYVVEKNTTENGTCVRYSDGTQYCWGSFDSPGTLDRSSGDLYFNSDVTFDFPLPFLDNDSYSSTASVKSYARWVATQPVRSGAGLRLIQWGTVRDAYGMTYNALGRWK